MKLNVALPARESGSDGTIFLLLKFKLCIEIFIHEIQMPESIEDSETPSRPSVSRRAYAMKQLCVEKKQPNDVFCVLSAALPPCPARQRLRCLDNNDNT
ncbi:hypothetical protein ACIQVE_15905 [Pseudomonas sp. NPDC098747]|uniref:hypothetical protein n=1 Tax=Pseudomonas sp. NPDC098747 TaxID=3364487 RepID=UPI00383BD24B